MFLLTESIQTQQTMKTFALRPESIWMNHPHWYFHQDGLLKDTTLIS